MCVLCDGPACWWWQNDPAGLAGPLPLCDECAADKNLDDLVEMRGNV